MALRWIVKTTPTPPAGQWYSVLTDESWSAGPGFSWTGSQWEASLGIPSGLSATGWESGYRPTKMRITFSGSISEIGLKDLNDDTIAIDSSPVSLEEITITFGSFDINDLTISYSGSIAITNIEFYSTSAP